MREPHDLENATERLRREAAARGVRAPAPEDEGLQFAEPWQLLERHRRGQHRPRRQIRGALAVAATVLVVAAGVTAASRLIAGDPDAGRPAGRPAATDHRDSDGQAEQGAQALARTSYWVVRSENHRADGTVVQVLDVLGNGRPGRRTTGETTVPTPAATFGTDGHLAWADLALASTTPEAVGQLVDGEARLHDGGSLASRRMGAVGVLLSEAPATDQLRLAVWELLAGTPGIVVTEDVYDFKGREGTRYTVGNAGAERVAYIVDDESGAILQSIHGDTRPGGSVERTVYLYEGPSDRMPATDLDHRVAPLDSSRR